MANIYYKVQFYCETSLTWKDIQRKHANVEEANITVKRTLGKKCRIIQVDGKKRTVVATYAMPLA